MLLRAAALILRKMCNAGSGTASNAQRIVDSLLEKDIIDCDDGSFVVADQFFQVWTRKTQTPEPLDRASRNQTAQVLPVLRDSLRVDRLKDRNGCEFEGIFNFGERKTGNTSGLKVFPDSEVPAMLFTYLTGSVTVPLSAEEPVIPPVE